MPNHSPDNYPASQRSSTGASVNERPASPTAPAPADAVAQGGSTTGAPRRSRIDRVINWALSASAVGLIVSIAVHLTAAILAAGIIVAPAGFGFGVGAGATGARTEIAVDTELTELTPLELQAIVAAPDAGALTPEPLPPIEFDDEITHAQPGLNGAFSGDTSNLGGSGLGGSGDGVDEGLDGGFGGSGAGGGSARFFGVEARGRRIAYIIDISGSMAGPRIETLKRALIDSIDGLHSQGAFSVVLFSTEALPLGGRAAWATASDSNKRNFARLVQRVEPGGMTIPQPAFEIVFGLRPRPDAVYFMTDGIFAAETAPYIEQLNRAAGVITPIHCISFISPESESLMRQIAEASDGSYTHVMGIVP